MIVGWGRCLAESIIAVRIKWNVQTESNRRNIVTDTSLRRLNANLLLLVNLF